MLIKAIEDHIFRKAAPLAVRYLAKPDLKATEPLVRRVLDQSAREFQVAPPVTIHMSDPLLMAGMWSATREAYVVNHKGRAMREAVAAAISTLNQCPYCVTVHTSLFASTSIDREDLQDPAKLSPEIRAAYEWANTTLSPHGNRLEGPDIPPSDLAQIYGTAVVYHYLNRIVSVFLGETPVALPGMKSTLGDKMMRASFTFFGKRFANLDPEPGQFILPDDAELPSEFSWAAANPSVAKGLAQFASAASSAGNEAVPDEVRALVVEHLGSWHGEQPPLSRNWLGDLVTPLASEHKPAARLALLTARASWQVDDRLISDFREYNPGDKALLQIVAWASFAASRRIASWFVNSQIHQSTNNEEKAE